MKQQLNDDQLITRYLLGELSDEEQTQLEERAFSDPDYLQHVRAGEKDLIDEYVRGELSDKMLPAFERRFFASEHRRRQIEFARALTQVAAESSGRASSDDTLSATTTGWHQLLLFWRGPKLAFGLSLAAIALIVIIGGVWVLWSFRQQRTEQAQTKPPLLQVTPVSQGSGTPQPTTEQRAQNGVSPAPLPNTGASPPAPQQPVIASLLLLTGTSRSAENVAQLNLQPQTTAVRLRIGIDKNEPYKHFRAELQTTAGKAIASQANLMARPSHDGKMIVWLIPASQLNSGEYELALSGLTQQGRTEAVGYYYFKVIKK